MSSESCRRKIQDVQKTIAGLQKDKGDSSKKIADLSKQLANANQSASRATSTSSRDSKLRDANRYQEAISRAHSRIADLDGKIAREHGRLTEAYKELAREEEREADRRRREEERRLREDQAKLRQIAGRLSDHDDLHSRAISAIEQLRQLPEQIVVLMLASNPLDQQQLRLDEEARSIAEMIRKSKHRDSVRFESRWAVRPLDVLQALNELTPRVVHFTGHGSQADEIVFQDNTGGAKLVSKEAIVQTMQASSGRIQLVFFNTCYSANQAQAVVKHVKAAIGMATSIGDDAARTFSAQFYSAIGFGLTVRVAFEQAKAALMLEGIPEETTPELFVADGVSDEALILVRPPDLTGRIDEKSELR